LCFVEELDLTFLIVLVFAGLQQEACEFVAFVAQQSVFSDPKDFLLRDVVLLGIAWA
jgi:hypothetical protein